MSVSSANPVSERIRNLLLDWLRQRAPEGVSWLDERCARIREGLPDGLFFAAFGMAPRRLGKADLALGPGELEQAGQARPGWTPARWSCDQAGRAALLLALDPAEPEAFERRLATLFEAADMGELAALYQALPLLPFPERHRARAAEGVRSNMVPVFEAVALDNPYPAEQLDEGAWNQMVLKAVFVGSPLHRIHGLDRRANAGLARMLIDYAHERWAAKRRVSPELWRPVGPFLGEDRLADLERVLADPDPAQQEAAALALAASPAPESRAVLSRRPDLARAVEEGRLDWPAHARERLGA